MNYIYTYIQDAASRVHNFLRFESSNVLQLEVSRAFLMAFQERLAQNASSRVACEKSLQLVFPVQAFKNKHPSFEKTAPISRKQTVESSI